MDFRTMTPTSDEIAIAQQSYLNWERAQAEDMAEYISRRRTVELADLVGEIIEHDLNAAERNMVRRYWFDGKSIPVIAKETQLNKSTVSRLLDRAYQKIEVLLRYVVQYQYNIRQTDFLPVAVREAFLLEAQRHRCPESIGGRLSHLRKAENLSLDTLAQAMELAPERLKQLEAETAQPTAEELLRFSAFFRVSADYILKGGSTLENQDAQRTGR